MPRLRLVIVALVALAAAAVLATACGGDGDGGASGKVRVVTSLPLFADMAREVGGDRVDVTALLPAGADPHTFEPSPRDVRSVAEADVLFANGLDLEPGAVKIMETNRKDGAPLVLLGERAEADGVQVINGNPHLWLDLANAREYARLIAGALMTADPRQSEWYANDYRLYLQALDSVDAYAKQTVAAIPETSRKFVTTHDAFTYFAQYLGFEIVAFVAQGPGQEPSPEDVADLTRAIRDEHVPAVFTEPQAGSEGRVLEQAAADAGVQVCTLYSDSLDDEVKTYIDLMRFDADELARCLGGADGG
ncbi:MAG: metal ABC transporter substrate-binding protein [Dehalococcoidia bacterium]|nr:metal ABC transporter substrate-binding protein [Dehalococcoidia bacterium]